MLSTPQKNPLFKSQANYKCQNLLRKFNETEKEYNMNLKLFMALQNELDQVI